MNLYYNKFSLYIFFIHNSLQLPTEKNRGAEGRAPVDIIFLHNPVFHTLLFRNLPVGGSASQIAAHPVNVTPEQVNNTMDQTD